MCVILAVYRCLSLDRLALIAQFVSVLSCKMYQLILKPAVNCMIYGVSAGCCLFNMIIELVYLIFLSAGVCNCLRFWAMFLKMQISIGYMYAR